MYYSILYIQLFFLGVSSNSEALNEILCYALKVESLKISQVCQHS